MNVSQTPQRAVMQTPLRNQTPQHSVTQTPQRSVIQTPQRSVIQTPQRSLTQTPQRSLTQTPQRSMIQSPQHPMTQTPRQSMTQSPHYSVTQSPHHSVTQTPQHSMSQTPQTNMTKKSRRSINRTPQRSSTQTPERAPYRPLNIWKKNLNRSSSWRERFSKGKENFKADLENILGDKFTSSHEVKMARKRERVLCEIFSTERRYQNHLAVIVEHFLLPLEKLGHIPTEDQRIIFENITAIQAVNRELLSHMEEKGITQGFIQLAPFMKVYCTYANNFEKASLKLQEWERKRAAFVHFLREQEAKPECGNLTLHALLITPIQRIPRYKLLLEELLSCTAENHEDYAKLQEAAARMAAVTHGVNEYIREHDNFQKMLLIQNSLHSAPRIIMPGRRFIMEGTLMKVNKKGSGAHERMFFLFNDMLIYAKTNILDPSLSSRSFTCRGVIQLDQCQVKCVLGDHSVTGTGALFKLEYNDCSLLLYSTSQHIALSWMDALQGAIQQLQPRPHAHRQSGAKKASLRGGTQRVPLGAMVKNLRTRSDGRQPREKRKCCAESEANCNTSQDTLHPMRMQLSRSTYRNTTPSKAASRRLQRGPLTVPRYPKTYETSCRCNKDGDKTAYYDCRCHDNEVCNNHDDDMDLESVQQAFCVIL